VPALWETKPDDVRRLQGASPRFTQFVNSVLRLSARAGGLGDDRIRTTVRDNIADGGVDAAIDEVVIGDMSGWLACPTAWQYKARAYSGIIDNDLRDEINKPYSTELLQAGYGYRLAISDGMPPQKKADWIRILTTESAKINPKAPPPLVLTEDDLAAWANRFPAVCIEFFKVHLKGLFQTFPEWQADTRALVPDFVAVDAWLSKIEGLADFIDLSKSVTSPIVTVQGEAGAGKTRLVCEAAARLGNGTSLLLYTKEERKAVELAQHIAAQNSCIAILVADECGLQSRVDIENVLTPHTKRARAICIDNSAQRPPTAGPEVIVDRPPLAVLGTILERNFPGIPAERRRAFVEMSGGFVRLAIDICRHNELIPQDGDPSQLMSYFYNHYLADRLDDARLRAVCVLSLLTKVGFKAEVEVELDQLSHLCGATRHDILTAVHQMKDAPGFVAFAGRFLYVTPAIIATTAFRSAWDRYVSIDVSGFLRKLPGEFVDRFTERVEHCGTPQMKVDVSDFFGHWTSLLNQHDLADEDKVRRLVQLVEIQPERFLPVLNSLVADTSLAQLRELHKSNGLGSGPRRQIVWFCERAVIISEYFTILEAILFRLSLAESEPNLGNNATQTWLGLFRVYLSGTAIPFADRFSILQRRATSGDEPTVSLALKALSQAIDDRGLSRMANPSVVMGRVPLEQWRPLTNSDRYACWQQTLNFMVEATHDKYLPLSIGVKELTVANLRSLLLRGFLAQLQRILDPATLPAELLPRLHEAIDDFFKYDADPSKMSAHYLDPIRAWAEQLRPADFTSRLVVAIGQDPWHSVRGKEEDAWKAELKALAERFISKPELISQHRSSLYSEHARSAYPLGYALGKEDANALLFSRIIDDAIATNQSRLATGYVKGLLESHQSKASTINSILDTITQADPRLAFELITAGGDEIHAFDRAIRLVKERLLGAEYLRLFEFGVQKRPLSENELSRVLDLLIGAVYEGNVRAANVGIHMLWTRIVWRHDDPDLNMFSNSETTEWVKQFLSVATPHISDASPFWDETLEAMLYVDAYFVIDLAIRALMAENQAISSEAEKVLATAAKDYAAVVLNRLIPVIADRNMAWRFRILKYDIFVKSLPTTSVSTWLDEIGVEGARALARSLPGPFLNQTGEPIVPEPTLTVLRRFGDDEAVLKEFSIGLHSFQTYSGDIAAQHEEEARVAERFLNHNVPAIRKWAQAEITDSKYHAKQARQEQEEFGI
jgi:hypothetical protein